MEGIIPRLHFLKNYLANRLTPGVERVRLPQPQLSRFVWFGTTEGGNQKRPAERLIEFELQLIDDENVEVINNRSEENRRIVTRSPSISGFAKQFNCKPHNRKRQANEAAELQPVLEKKSKQWNELPGFLDEISPPEELFVSEGSDSEPYIKDEVIQFLLNKISNRDMLRIRQELMELKQSGNYKLYLKLTKTAPLAADLIHDMFCPTMQSSPKNIVKPAQ